MGTHGPTGHLHPQTHARHHPHARHISTPLEPDTGWPLGSTVIYTIDENVPKPLHDAIRKGVRHWNRALEKAHIPLHYTYRKHAPHRAANHHVFKVIADMVQLREVIQPPFVSPEVRAFSPVGFGEDLSPSHAWTELPRYSARRRVQTITTEFFDRGLFVRVPPGEAHGHVLPSGNTVLVQKNSLREDGSRNTALVAYDECAPDEIVGVVVHEIGHALGLAHTTSSLISTVMHGQTRELSRTRPKASDIDALRKRMRP